MLLVSTVIVGVLLCSTSSRSNLALICRFGIHLSLDTAQLESWLVRSGTRTGLEEREEQREDSEQGVSEEASNQDAYVAAGAAV